MLERFELTNDNHRNIKRVLRVLYGIGFHRADYICSSLGLKNYMTISCISAYHFELLVEFTRKFYVIESKLIFIKDKKIAILKQILSYRGLRLINHLPLRGQRTCSNAKTRIRFKIT